MKLNQSMKTTMSLAAAMGTLALTSINASAALVVATDVAAGQTAYDGDVTTSLTTTSTVTAPSSALSPTFSVSGLSDGSAAGNGNFTYYDTASMSATIKFSLTGSATGYDISNITSIAGWGDSNIGSQSFELFLAGADENYTSYGIHTNQSTSGNFATRTVLTDDTGTIASGVQYVQFVFTNPTVSQGGNGGTLIRELMVQGTAVIPEPSSAALLGLGGLALILRRRK
jgi:hypothetical protein